MRLVEAPPAQPISGAVSVRVDDASHTIQLYARLGFWTAAGAPSPELVERVTAAITTRWDGLHYLCYTTDVILDVQAYGGIDEVPLDRVDVEVVDGGPFFRSSVNRRPEGRAISDDPANLGTISHGGEHSRWLATDGIALAHEFGHVLGLDDGYDKQTGAPLPGHTLDMMADVARRVSMQMITRLLRRHGIDPSTLHCPMRFDAGPSSLNLVLAELKDIRIHAECDRYDPPTDDPDHPPRPMVFTGTVTLQAGYLMGKDLQSLRDFVGKLTRQDVSTLANDYPLSMPVTFEVPPSPSAKRSRQILDFSIDPGPGISFEGMCEWSTIDGVPTCIDALILNGLSTAGFLPGPPLYGVFSVE